MYRAMRRGSGLTVEVQCRVHVIARAAMAVAWLLGCTDDVADDRFVAGGSHPEKNAPRDSSAPNDGAFLDRTLSPAPEAAFPPKAEASVRDADREASTPIADAGRDGERDARHDGISDARTPIERPPPFTAKFVWRPITFERAVDLGHHAEPVRADAQVEPGAVTLKEVGESAGLANVVSGGNPHGTGVAFVDVDGDGYDDLFFANGWWTDAPPTKFASVLYLNHRDGTFVDATESSGLKAILAGVNLLAVAAADYDADGDFDFYVTTNPKDMLLQNDGAGHFVDVTAAAGAGGGLESSAAYARTGRGKIVSWGDFDSDGWLDVAVASSLFPGYPGNGYLLRNKGDGTFEGATNATGYAAAPTGSPCALMWTDYDNDGDQDLMIWNDQGTGTENRVLLQNDGGHFTNVGVAANLIDYVGNPMGIDGADIDRNGFLDYYVSNIGGNPLYLANGDGTFTNIMTAAGVAGTFGWGLGFEDLNADTWPDIFVSQLNGKYDMTFTHQGIVPPKFTPAWWSPSPTLYTGWLSNVGTAFADYDKNGTVDVVRETTDGSRVTLYRNDTSLGSDGWLEVRIGRAPRTGERGGISARVVVKTGDLVQFSDIKGGAGRTSASAVSARFGLGQWTGADWVAALWPDGRELSALNVPGNRTVALSAP